MPTATYGELLLLNKKNLEQNTQSFIKIQESNLGMFWPSKSGLIVNMNTLAIDMPQS